MAVNTKKLPSILEKKFADAKKARKIKKRNDSAMLPTVVKQKSRELGPVSYFQLLYFLGSILYEQIFVADQCGRIYRLFKHHWDGNG